MTGNPATSLGRSIQEEVDQFWSTDLHIEAAWDRDDGSAAILYRTTRDPLQTLLGRVFSFGPGVADDSFSGAVSAAALTLAEPPGSVLKTARTDHHGVTWLALDPSPIPIVPPIIQAQITPHATN
jgi:hypothetical protein